MYFAFKVIEFCTLYRLHIFCYSIQLQYFGTDTYDSQKILANISLTLSKLKMVYTVRRKIVAITQDDLFSSFTELFLSSHPNLCHDHFV